MATYINVKYIKKPKVKEMPLSPGIVRASCVFHSDKWASVITSVSFAEFAILLFGPLT